MAVGGLTSEEGTDSEDRLEAGLLGNSLILQAELDVEGVGEDDRFLLFDAFLVVELARQFHEVGRVAGVLTDAGIGLGVARGVRAVLGVVVGGRRGDRRLGACFALH